MPTQVRKLAAIELIGLGPIIIIPEFALGVLGPFTIGLLMLRRGVSMLGLYILLIGLNYVPLLIHAGDLWRSGTARQELGVELDDRARAYRKYRRQKMESCSATNECRSSKGQSYRSAATMRK